ncbi:aldehyde dehydrogenase [Salinicola rhizosphaerae]|uniref:Aldehyde dehydrogenase n=1 Tax=Salinicola rhizosphaerae TaxID=1443141 RepID=A0ABQ3DUT1_9GAMM|nr:aldehyde dehydrogenase [Salinicola rhizosphaerae]GHB17163.1 aldehyde dehydrogenase [Salinicola rhizosphaerae]
MTDATDSRVAASGDALPRYGVFIDGRECAAVEDQWYATHGPFDGEAWAEIARASAADVETAVDAADRALSGPWSQMSASERGRCLMRLADLIVERAPQLAEIEMRDNGKLATEVTGQVRYTAEYYRYYGGLADKIESSVIPTDKKGVFAYTRYEAKGVVAIITPWNSPLSLTTWKLAPALAAGCTVVVKPSEFTSASMVEFAKLFEEAGFPPGVVNVITGFGNEVGEPLVTHPKVAHIGFTGGDQAGRRIYELAARHLKTVTLELGGKSPQIVFDDADIEQAVKGVVSGIFAASGQTCLAGSRLLVHESIHDEFVERLVAFVADARLGDPLDSETRIGPIATPGQFRKIMEYIEIAKGEGAHCALGGNSRPELGAGQFVEPTIFTGVTPKMRIAQEEVFGPVLVVMPFTDEDHAVELANDTSFGLAAGIWTRDLHRTMSMVERVKAGTVWVNNYRATSYTSPFGGFKQSGIGRESGVDAIREYLDTKCVWISSDLQVANPFVRR